MNEELVTVLVHIANTLDEISATLKELPQHIDGSLHRASDQLTATLDNHL
jgi:uncharacterized protein YoxC